MAKEKTVSQSPAVKMTIDEALVGHVWPQPAAIRHVEPLRRQLAEIAAREAAQVLEEAQGEGPSTCHP